jgi:uncharacterized protein (DUF2249 family)
VPEERAASEEPVVDTRAHPDLSCADLTTRAVTALSVGESFVLVADHDPRPLRYLLAAEMPGVTDWQPLDDGPELWRARISKVSAPA